MGNRMNRSQWNKTPYAGTGATGTDEQISRLLAKYGVHQSQVTQGVGPHGRPAYLLRFELKEKMYRVMLEGLDAENVSHAELLAQVKRALFYYLKSTLEMQSVFFTAEQALFAFLELPGSACTMYEAAAPRLQGMTVPKLQNLLGPAVTDNEGNPL